MHILRGYNELPISENTENIILTNLLKDLKMK